MEKLVVLLIHTAQANIRISSKDFDILSKQWRYEKDNKNLKINKPHYINYDFAESGIILWVQRVKTDVYYSTILFARINFTKLINPVQKEKLYNVDDLPLVIRNFNSIIRTLPTATELYNFEYWNAKRIDFTIDVITPFADSYIELINLGDKKYTLNASEYTDSAFLKRKNPNGCMNINIYNKEHEALEKNKKEDSREVLYRFNSILRIEIQSNYSKLYNMKRQYLPHEDEGTLLISFLKPNNLLYLHRNVFFKELYKIVKAGKYYDIDTAIRIINRSDYSKKIKKNCRIIIRDIHKKDYVSIINKKGNVEKIVRFGIWGSRERLSEKKIISNATYNSTLKKIMELGINPVTMSKEIRNKHRNYMGIPKEIKRLSSVIDLYEKQLKLPEYDIYI